MALSFLLYFPSLPALVLPFWVGSSYPHRDPQESQDPLMGHPWAKICTRSLDLSSATRSFFPLLPFLFETALKLAKDWQKSRRCFAHHLKDILAKDGEVGLFPGSF